MERVGPFDRQREMQIVLFCHSLISDWNHGNAHFLRGVVGELQRRGHQMRVFEPVDGWSLRNLLIESGEQAVADFHAAYPSLRSTFYDPATIDLDAALDDADLVIVHEWSDHELVRRLGQHRRGHDYRLLFHDTHHRAITAPAAMAAYDLTNFDGVLVFGEILRRIYLERGWARAAWTWHEAADTRVFRPEAEEKSADLVWVGNWGDDERTRELGEYLLGPVRDLDLRATVHGVRYPPKALEALESAGVTFCGHVANHRVPQVFARHRIAVHVPRRPYAEALPGIPTIRVFEALACRIPLVCAPWNDVEHLFDTGADFLLARDGAEMRRHLRAVASDLDYAAAVAEHGYRTVLARHTCAHRVDELLKIAAEDLGLDVHREDQLACAEV